MSPIKKKFAVTIRKPPEDLYAAFINLQRWPEWVSILLEVKDIEPNPIQVGTKFIQHSRILGKNIITDSKIVTLDSNRTFEYIGGGTIPLELRCDFEETDQGTRVILFTMLDPGRFFGIPRPLVERGVTQMVKTDLANFKKWIENT